MSKTNLFAAIVAAFALLACNEETVDIPSAEDDEFVTIRLEAINYETKSLSTSDGSAINNLQYLVFDSDGKLEAYKKETTKQTCNLVCTKGSKTFVVIANYNTDLKGVEHIDELKTYKADLFENTIDLCVMEGTAKVNVDRSKSVAVTISRLVSRLILNKVTVNFEMDYLKTADVKLKAIYLINLVGEMYFQSSNLESQIWYNKMAPEITDKDIVYDDCGNVKLTNGVDYTTQHRFYLYSNANHTDSSSSEWSERATKCVVELLVNDVTYYYPMALTFHVNPNYDYLLNLTITRLGSDSPNESVLTYTLFTDVTVAEWGDSVTYGITI